MMGMHPKAKLLRHSLSSKVLGGMHLDDFISEEDLEALEACVVVFVPAAVLLSLTRFALQRETQRFRHGVHCRGRPRANCVHFARRAGKLYSSQVYFDLHAGASDSDVTRLGVNAQRTQTDQSCAV